MRENLISTQSGKNAVNKGSQLRSVLINSKRLGNGTILPTCKENSDRNGSFINMLDIVFSGVNAT